MSPIRIRPGVLAVAAALLVAGCTSGPVPGSGEIPAETGQPLPAAEQPDAGPLGINPENAAVLTPSEDRDELEQAGYDVAQAVEAGLSCYERFFAVDEIYEPRDVRRDDVLVGAAVGDCLTDPLMAQLTEDVAAGGRALLAPTVNGAGFFDALVGSELFDPAGRAAEEEFRLLSLSAVPAAENSNGSGESDAGSDVLLRLTGDRTALFSSAGSAVLDVYGTWTLDVRLSGETYLLHSAQWRADGAVREGP